MKERFPDKPTGTDTLDHEAYYQPDHLRYRDHVYKDSIKTVRLHRKGWELSPPILRLGSGDQLELSFDDLRGGNRNFAYTVVHCKADWTPTDIMRSEYLGDFYEDEIIDQRYSFNTVVDYSHYRVAFPNRNFSVLLSGNYLLKVWDENTGDLILTRRFMVWEEQVNIKGTINQPRGFDDMKRYQEVDFNIEHENFPIKAPFRDLRVVVRQNGRWDNAITDLQPRFIKEKQLVYNYDNGANRFEGGNEFRKINLQSMRYQTEEIRTIRFDSSKAYQVYLQPDPTRRYRPHYADPDINGQYTIKTNDAPDNALSSEYVYVHFRLPFENELPGGNLYVFGQLSDWRFLPSHRLRYNYQKNRYETTLFLKQGYYNYLYAFLEDKSQSANLNLIEGSHFDTENDYTILVYYKDITADYEQLIGVKHLNSRN